jgi:transcriptional regulator with XRE-family HTH domain
MSSATIGALDGNQDVSESQTLGAETPRAKGDQVATNQPVNQADQDRERKKRGALFWRRREELGYTGGPGKGRPAFEQDTGIHRRTAADLENGYRDNFKVDTLNHIARAYRVTYDSASAVLRGEADELVPAAPLPAGIPVPAPGLPPTADPLMDDPPPGTWRYIRNITNQVTRLAAENRIPAEDVPGGLLFPGDPRNAGRWDDEGLHRAFTLWDRIRIVAVVLATEAGRPSELAG